MKSDLSRKRLAAPRGHSRPRLRLLVSLAFIALAAAVGAPATATAQADDPFVPGQRVRFSLWPESTGDAAMGRLTGVITASGPATMSVRVHSSVSPIDVPFRAVERVELSLGPESAWQSAGRGGRNGLMLGVIIGALVGSEVSNSGVTRDPPLRVIATRVATYGISLGASGAILGALNPGERWRRVPDSVIARRRVREDR